MTSADSRIVSICTVLGLFFVALLPQTSGADSAIHVAVRFHDCRNIDTALVRRLLDLELSSAAPPSEARSGTAARVALRCEQTALIIDLHDLITGKSLQRRVVIGDQDGRERVIALAVLELLVASWLELEARPLPGSEHTAVDGVGAAAGANGRRLPAQAQAQSPGPSATDNLRESVRRLTRRRLRPPSSTTALSVSAGPLLLDGTHAAVTLTISRRRPDARWGFAAGGFAHHGNKSVALGKLRATAAGAFAAAEWRIGPPAARPWLAGGLRVGAIQVTGRSNDSAIAVTGPALRAAVLGPFVRAGLESQLTGGLLLHLMAEGGTYLLGARALVDGRTQFDLSGTWLSVSLGTGWSW